MRIAQKILTRRLPTTTTTTTVDDFEFIDDDVSILTVRRGDRQRDDIGVVRLASSRKKARREFEKVDDEMSISKGSKLDYTDQIHPGKYQT